MMAFVVFLHLDSASSSVPVRFGLLLALRLVVCWQPHVHSFSATNETSHFPAADDNSAVSILADACCDEFCGKRDDSGGCGDVVGVFNAVETSEFVVVGGYYVH